MRNQKYMSLENKFIDNNCIYIISQFIKNHKFSINIDGKIFKILPLVEYKIRLLNLISLMMIGFLAHIIRKIPFHPITIMGNTIYSRVAAYCLSQHDISYVLCKGTNQITYYQTINGDEIAFEGLSPKHFSQDMEIPLIPHSIDELTILEEHTKLKNLEHIQKLILSKFNIKDGVHLLNIKDINTTTTNTVIHKNPIINIKHFCGNLYYIMTNDDIWISRLIISDIVTSLQSDEIITGFRGITKEQPNDKYEIHKFPDHCIINQPEFQTTLYNRQMYQVLSDLSISTLHDDDDNCIIYSLKIPRQFDINGINILHPFHLPIKWDPFLTIMIIVYALM